jgi:hypothetical protein
MGRPARQARWRGLRCRQTRGERHLGLLEPSRELTHPARK